MPTRTSAKAIIIKDGKLLCVKGSDSEGDWYALPGGGQRQCEPLPEALRRECLEELSVSVTVRDLRFVRDYIRADHPWHGPDWHQVELMFICDLADGTECKAGAEPDTYQEGIEWIPIDRLEEYRLFPKALRKAIPRIQDGDTPVYLGGGD